MAKGNGKNDDGPMLVLRTATVRLESLSAYSQSKRIWAKKEDNESHDDFEERSWKERLTLKDGKVYIGPMSFKKALQGAAGMLGDKVPGQGGAAKFVKHFVAGVMITDGIVTDYTPDTVLSEKIGCNSKGKRGGSIDVARRFPMIPKWSGQLQFYIYDPHITSDVFRKHLEAAGLMIGVGRFRPENGGYLGTFRIVDFKWE